MTYIQNEKNGQMRGRELMFKTPEEFEEKFLQYCEHCDATGDKPCATGLAWFMGFASRQSVWEYRSREGFEHIANRAMLFVEKGYEQQLANGRGDAGVIFALKQFGWSDKQEIEHSEKVVDSGENEW